MSTGVCLLIHSCACISPLPKCYYTQHFSCFCFVRLKPFSWLGPISPQNQSEKLFKYPNPIQIHTWRQQHVVFNNNKQHLKVVMTVMRVLYIFTVMSRILSWRVCVCDFNVQCITVMGLWGENCSFHSSTYEDLYYDRCLKTSLRWKHHICQI